MAAYENEFASPGNTITKKKEGYYKYFKFILPAKESFNPGKVYYWNHYR
jgi:hypothetical protein